MTDSSVSQDYLACNKASLCSCDVATLLEPLFPLLQTSFRRGFLLPGYSSHYSTDKLRIQ